MMRVCQWITLAVLAFHLMSCGLIGGLTRTAANLMQNAVRLAGPAAAAGVL